MLIKVTKFFGEQYQNLRLMYFPGIPNNPINELYSEEVSRLFDAYKKDKDECTSSSEAKQLYEHFRQQLDSICSKFGYRNSTDKDFS